MRNKNKDPLWVKIVELIIQAMIALAAWYAVLK